MSSLTKLMLRVSFAAMLMLFLLSGVIVTANGLSNTGIINSDKLLGLNWVWISAIIFLGLVFFISSTIFVKNNGEKSN